MAEQKRTAGHPEGSPPRLALKGADGAVAPLVVVAARLALQAAPGRKAVRASGRRESPVA